MKTSSNTIERILRKSLVAGSLAMAVSAPGAFAASGTTSIDIDFPPLLILYYYDEIPIDVDAAAFATATGMDSPAACSTDAPGVSCNASTGSPAALTAAPGVITTATDIEGDMAAGHTIDTEIDFDINNAWAVRSLGISSLDATITQGAGDFVAGSATSDLAGSGTVTSSLTLTSGQNIGDLQFAVELEDLADASTASDTITITVIPTPAPII